MSSPARVIILFVTYSFHDCLRLQKWVSRVINKLVYYIVRGRSIKENSFIRVQVVGTQIKNNKVSVTVG